jgi:hydroxyacylglutathione hydrolase
LQVHVLFCRPWELKGVHHLERARLTVQELKTRLDRHDNLIVLDVRSEEERGESHIDGAIHIYVGHLEERLNEIPVDQPTAVICSVGNRASLGASILLRAGRREVYNLLGGMMAWQKADYVVI